jgi:simple sugar transport system ATP-binding protein
MFRKNFGAIQALNEVSLTLEEGQVVGLMGDNWRRQVDAGQRSSPAIFAPLMAASGSMARTSSSIGRSRRGSTGSRSCIRIWRFATISRRRRNVYLGRELRKKIGPLRLLDHWAMYKRSGSCSRN